jgi:hypothetical protein
MANQPSPNGKDRLFSKHLILVLALLFALLVTEFMIFKFIDNATAEGITQKDIFALTFGAFGTWIGAGAAYFFGRENMRTATESLLKMQGRSPEEILAATTLHEMGPKAIDQTFKASDTIESVMNWLKKSTKNFFMVLVDDDGRYQRVVNEEAVDRFVYDEMENNPTKKFEEIQKGFKTKTVQAIVDRFKAQEGLQDLVDYAIPLNEDIKASTANTKLDSAGKYIAIVVDAQNNPTGSITTADIRRLLVGTK